MKLPVVLLALLSAPLLAEPQLILDSQKWPEGWTNDAQGSTEVKFVEKEGRHWLEVRREQQGVGAALFWNGPGQRDGQLGSLSGSVILCTERTARSDAFGVLLGAQAPVWNNTAGTNHRAYYLAIIPERKGTGTGALGIWYNTRTTQTESSESPLAEAAFPSAALLSGHPVLLTFSVRDEKIEAALWELDESGEKTGTALAELAYTTGAPITGALGLKAGRLGNTTARWFTDLKVELVD